MNYSAAYPPSGLCEVLLELFGDGGVDVPLGLLASDPAVLQCRAEESALLSIDIQFRRKLQFVTRVWGWVEQLCGLSLM